MTVTITDIKQQNFHKIRGNRKKTHRFRSICIPLAVIFARPTVHQKDGATTGCITVSRDVEKLRTQHGYMVIQII